MSDFIPNSFQTPNAYVDRLMAFLTNDEWKVLCYMARRVFGFSKREDRISLSQMENGLTDSNGNRLDYGTGLSRPALVKALAGLRKYNIAREVAPNDPRRNEGALYAPQLDSGQVDWQGLEARREEAKAEGRKRTGKARSELKKQREEGAVSESNQQERGQQDLPHPVSESNRTQLAGLTHNNQLETQKKNSMAANDARRPSASQSSESLPEPSRAKRIAHAKTSHNPPSQQAALFESQPMGARGQRREAGQTEPHQTARFRKPDPLWDAIAEAWGAAPGMIAVIKQQLLGQVPKNKPHHGCNFDVPATSDEVRDFAAWYVQKCKGCPMPTAPAKIQNQFYAFRREQSEQEEAGMDGCVFIPGLGYQRIAV